MNRTLAASSQLALRPRIRRVDDDDRPTPVMPPRVDFDAETARFFASAPQPETSAEITMDTGRAPRAAWRLRLTQLVVAVVALCAGLLIAAVGFALS